ncbi:MAG TPA: cbb3-type cytochrome c oxidase subunit 3 [Planctomycetota bacterium]|nr:cbb3-type cytochrome c oxidase subunit 3 [Planctomycetota bacterium]
MAPVRAGAELALLQAAEAAEGAGGADLGWMKSVATVFFVLLFLAIVARLLLARRGHYDATARIPLHDDRAVEPREEARHG